MTFVKTPEGEYIPVSEVIGAWELNATSTSIELIRNGGETTQVTREEWEKATAALTYQFVPAAPGTFLLHRGHGEGGVWAAREPIIAWAIDRSGIPTPVTENGIYQSETVSPARLHPDGSVRDALGLHESIEAWLGNFAAEVAPRT